MGGRENLAEMLGALCHRQLKRSTMSVSADNPLSFLSRFNLVLLETSDPSPWPSTSPRAKAAAKLPSTMEAVEGIKWQDHHWLSKVGLWGSSLPAWLSNTCYELRTSVQWATIVYQYDGGTAKPGRDVGCILPQTTEEIHNVSFGWQPIFFSLGSILRFSRPQIFLCASNQPVCH